ncbi:hypothetical protein Lal_00030760, partial [Lupinus albus]
EKTEEEPEKRCENNRKKMIYRKWSLLTGPATIFGGIVATVAVANFIFVKNDPFIKPHERNFKTLVIQRQIIVITL